MRSRGSLGPDFRPGMSHLGGRWVESRLQGTSGRGHQSGGECGDAGDRERTGREGAGGRAAGLANDSELGGPAVSSRADGVAC